MEDANKGAETSEADKENKKDNVAYWLRWIPAAKKAAQRHFDDAKAAYDEYLDEQRQTNGQLGTRDSSRKVYPAYFSSCETLEPAFYSRTPNAFVKRRFSDVEDMTALTMSLIQERMADWLLESTNFDSTMTASVGDFIHASKATTQVIFKVNTKTNKIYLDEGMLAPPDCEVCEDDEGASYYEEVITDGHEVQLAPVPYDEVLHTPEAKNQAEILEMAYFFTMPEEEARARFGIDKDGKERTLPFKNNKGSDRQERDSDRSDLPGKYLDGWEVWCLETKSVYWVNEGFKEEFLDSTEDPYHLKGFFPSPRFILAAKPPKSLYPTPLYVRCQPTLEKLHTMRSQMFDLIRSVRRRAIVDGSNDELITALEDLEGGEFIASGELTKIVEKGGIANLVMYLPVADLVDAIKEFLSLAQEFNNDFNQWFGTPDVIKGISDAAETATAQDIKETSAHNRFNYRKKQVAGLARDSLAMMVDMAIGLFPDEKIADIVGLRFMSPEHQQRFPEALELCRNDKENLIRVDIETDSTSFQDEELKQQKRNAISETVMTGLQQIGSMAQSGSPFTGVAFQVFLTTVAGLGGDKQFQDGIEAAMKDAQKAQEAPPPPAPPDYEQMKLDLQNQKQQMDAQLKQQQQQLDMQVTGRELAQKDFELQLKAQAQNADAQFKGFELQQKAKMDAFLQAIEAAGINIEQLKANTHAKKAETEAAALTYEAEAKMLEPSVPEDSAASTPAATVVINNHPTPPPAIIHAPILPNGL